MLSRQDDGRIAMPFVTGDLALLPGLEAEAVALDIQSLLTRFQPDDAEVLRIALRRSEREMKPISLVLRLADGSSTVEIKASPQCAAGEGAISWNGFFHQVTPPNCIDGDLKTQYEQVLLLNQQLEQNARTVEEYATELEVSREQLKVTQAWYRSILHLSPDGMLVCDERGTIVLVNEELCRMFGFHEAELVGQPVEKLLPFDGKGSDCGPYADFVEAVTLGGDARNVAGLGVQRKDGSEFFIDVTSSSLPDIDGFGAMVCACLRDITQRLDAERKLKAALKFSEGVINAIPDLLFELDGEGRYLNVWAQTPELLAANRELLLGRTVHEMLSAEAAATVMACVRTAEQEGRSYGYCIAIDLPDGERRWFGLSAAKKVGMDGAAPSFIMLSRDITDMMRAEHGLKEMGNRLLTVLNTIPDLLWLKDAEGIYLACNPQFASLCGRSESEVVGKTDYDLFPAKLAEFFRDRDRMAVEAGEVLINEEWVTYPDSGQQTMLETRKVPIFDADGRITGVLGVGHDITERKQMEMALASREREFRTLVENSPDTVARYGADLKRVYVNPAFASRVEGGVDTLIGRCPTEVPGGPSAALYEWQLAQVFEDAKEIEFELAWQDKDGEARLSLIKMTPELDASGNVESVLAIGRDITELHASRQKIHQMAFYDPLTDLPNRALFGDRLRQMLTDAKWHSHLAAVMMVDMDQFKTVNDTLGHSVGDELLREAAARLTASVRAYDTVARLGGDEFAILLPDIRSAEDLGPIASKILDNFKERFLLDGKEVFVSCSIGIALYPDDSAEAEDLLKFADSAMYFAKRAGRNGFRFYSRDMTQSANDRLMLESELRRAVEREELELHYQPKVTLQSGEVIGSEALLRWFHPQLGMVPPNRFIPVAEDTGIILELGLWVLRDACRTAAEWNGEGKPLHKVAINLSPRQFRSQDLVAVITDVLRETGCRPQWVELEITEGLLLGDDGDTLETLGALRALGITIAIDDFGTGYSALSYLARFPIDTLKIDRAFIQGVTTDGYRSELVKAILSIARSLKQQVVAEGVETLEQAAFLEANGCQVAQGYLYSKPVPKPEMAARFRIG